MIRAIDNHGERLVPGESHDREEAIRHKSSYLFFKAVVAADRERLGAGRIRILDLGCGVGHGSATLGEIDGSEVVGIDASSDAIEYARRHYAAPNIVYVATTADGYLDHAAGFDYVVSRHVLEHIPNGLSIALEFTPARRLIVNVPYKEPAYDAYHRTKNPHHELSDISEADFAAYPNREFFYEDLAGVTTMTADGANSIICVSSAPGLEPAASLLSFPIPAWRPNRLEEIALSSIRERAVIQRFEPALVPLARSLRAARRISRRLSRAGG